MSVYRVNKYVIASLIKANILILLLGSDYVIINKMLGARVRIIASVAHLLVVEPLHHNYPPGRRGVKG